MNVKEITIGLTEDEFDTLGNALECYLEKEISLLKNKNDIDLLLDTEVDLLRRFASMGYTMYIRKEDAWCGKLTHDVDEWVKHVLKNKNVVK